MNYSKSIQYKSNRAAQLLNHHKLIETRQRGSTEGGREEQTLATSAAGAAAAGADPAPGRFTPTPLPGNLQRTKHISHPNKSGTTYYLPSHITSMDNELQHWTSDLEATAAATVSYHRAALGNSAPGFDGTAANTLMSSLLIASLQKQNNHHKQTQLASKSLEIFTKFEVKTSRSLITVYHPDSATQRGSKQLSANLSVQQINRSNQS